MTPTYKVLREESACEYFPNFNQAVLIVQQWRRKPTWAPSQGLGIPCERSCQSEYKPGDSSQRGKGGRIDQDKKANQAVSNDWNETMC